MILQLVKFINSCNNHWWPSANNELVLQYLKNTSFKRLFIPWIPFVPYPKKIGLVAWVVENLRMLCDLVGSKLSFTVGWKTPNCSLFILWIPIWSHYQCYRWICLTKVFYKKLVFFLSNHPLFGVIMLAQRPSQQIWSFM